MKIKLLGVLIFICSILACNKDSLQEEDSKKLEEMASKIMAIIEATNCRDAYGWAYVGFGSRACGGSSKYIAYPDNINRVEFLQLVEEHRQAVEEYNKKWGIISNCLVTPEPKTIICEEGKPVFTY